MFECTNNSYAADTVRTCVRIQFVTFEAYAECERLAFDAARFECVVCVCAYYVIH